MAAGFDAGFGLVSKKPPPPPVDAEVKCGEAIVERWLGGLSKAAKGLGFGCCCDFGSEAEAGELKLKPLNASSRPPKLDCCWTGAVWDGGDCMPPKEGCRSCCG